jgi:hypothetical protein
MTLKHLYIDLDKTLLPYDSFPRFVPAFLKETGNWPLGLPILFWAISGSRPKIRPALALCLKDKDSQKLKSFFESWIEKTLMPDIRKNLLPPFPFSLASMSMNLIIDPLAKKLGAEESLSTFFGEENGKYSGLLSSPQCGGAGKAQMIEEDVKKRGLELSEVGLLTDHHRDIPALEIVGHPIIVSPSQKLSDWNLTAKAPVLDHKTKPDWASFTEI